VWQLSIRQSIDHLYIILSQMADVCQNQSQKRLVPDHHTYYFLKRYWHENQTTMEQFAQLSDFIIRYVGNPELPLDDAVGLDGQDNQYQYPQIVFIPDDPEFCRIYNGGLPKVDCSPTTARLIEFRHNSENMINILRQIPAPWGPLSVHF
jgi:hypothetical protein